MTALKLTVDLTRLDDPVYVYQCMDRGQIAMLSPEHAQFLYANAINASVQAAFTPLVRQADVELRKSYRRILRIRNFAVAATVLNFVIMVISLTIG